MSGFKKIQEIININLMVKIHQKNKCIFYIEMFIKRKWIIKTHRILRAYFTQDLNN